MRLEFILYALLFIVIGMMLFSLFLVWHWFDAYDRLKVVREVTREQTIQEIHQAHNKCRVLIYIGLGLALLYIPLPFILQDFYTTLVYPGVVIIVYSLLLIGLRSYVKKYINVIDEFVAENEDHIRELAEVREQDREIWRRDADVLNAQAKQEIEEIFEGNGYEVWFPHDILLNRFVLANKEMGIMYAQGIVIPFKQIMEVRHGRKDLKLFTNNSMHPFVNLDFGVLPINPETGMKYKDEIAEKLSHLMQ